MRRFLRRLGATAAALLVGVLLSAGCKKSGAGKEGTPLSDEQHEKQLEKARQQEAGQTRPEETEGE